MTKPGENSPSGSIIPLLDWFFWMDFWHRGAWNSAEIQIFGGFFGVIFCSFGAVGKGRVVLELGFFWERVPRPEIPQGFSSSLSIQGDKPNARGWHRFIEEGENGEAEP